MKACCQAHSGSCLTKSSTCAAAFRIERLPVPLELIASKMKACSQARGAILPDEVANRLATLSYWRTHIAWLDFATIR
jgi:hypothetical protein